MRWVLLLAVLGLSTAGGVEYFGIAVAVSERDTAVGAPFERGGAVYVYSGGQRQRVANPGNDVTEWFGCAVALSG